jgi:hypothetical protein
MNHKILGLVFCFSASLGRCSVFTFSENHAKVHGSLFSPVEMMKKCPSNRGFFIPHRKTWRSLVKSTMALRLIAPTRSIEGSRKTCPNEFQNYLQGSLKGAVSGQRSKEASMV